MAIWNKSRNHIDGTIHGKELRDWVKERKQERAWHRKQIFGDNDSDTSIYQVGFFITGIIAFFACWIYAFVSWGLLLGLGLGWIPSIFVAIIVGAIWPLIALVLVGGLCIIAYVTYRG